MKRISICATVATIAILTLLSLPVKATDVNVDIKPATRGFGQSVLCTFIITDNKKPVKNAPVEIWFSGQKGIQTTHVKAKTDGQGRVSKTLTIPRDWKPLTRFVDVNISCESAAVLQLFRVLGK